MFNTKPKLRYCPDCQSPNPTDRDTCFFCHAAFEPSGDGIPRQSTFAQKAGYTSPGNADIAYPALPSGWQAHAQPSGEVVIIPAFLNRWRTPIGKGVGIAALITVGMIVGLYAPHRDRPSDHSALPVLYFIVALCAFVALVGGIALLIKREEIRVGHGWLVWKEIWGSYISERAITNGGGLRIDTSEHRGAKGGHWWERALIAENLSERAILMRMTRNPAFFSLFGERPVFVGDDAARIGAYLAAVTGWQLADPENGAY